MVSPILANTFLHYAFDFWMTRTHPDLPWCRYADDGLVHCRSEHEAQALKAELQARLAECGLEMHPTKTKIVYCKDGKRKARIRTVKFDFLGYCFRPRLVRRRPGQHPVLWLQPRGQRLGSEGHAVGDSGLESSHENPAVYDEIRPPDSIRFFGGGLPTTGDTRHRRCAPLLRYVNQTLLAWAMRKFKRFKAHKIRASQFLQQLAAGRPDLFVHWHRGMVGTFA